MSGLRCLSEVPAGLLDAEPQKLLALLGGPTLIHLEGAVDGGPQPAGALFVSVLLHGNETSGWYALRQLLRDQPAPPRDLLLFIGNVEAAAQGVRRLPGQGDFNRMWRAPTGIARQVLQRATAVPLLAVVDLHNNTGKNPHYAVLTDFSPGSLSLAAMFGDTAVYIEEPATVLTRAFSPGTPNVTLELGPINDSRATARAYDFLCRLLPLASIPPAAPDGVRLYRTLARVHPRPGARFGFAQDGTGTTPVDDNRALDSSSMLKRDAAGTSPVEGNRLALNAAAATPPHDPQAGLDLVLNDAIEAANFARLPPGTVFGTALNGTALRVLQVLDNDHTEVTERFFDIHEGRISLKTSVVPAMYTTDPDVVRQDCLCYFMEPLDLNEQSGAGP